MLGLLFATPGIDTDVPAADAEVLLAANADLSRFGADGIVELAAAAQRLLSKVQAIQLRAIEALRQRRGSDRETGDEVGLALAMSKHAADRKVDLAKDLHGRFPRTLDAMGRGTLDEYKASRVVEIAAALPDELARKVDEQMQDRLAGRDATAIGQSVRYRVQRLDPEGAEVRARRRRRYRRVALQHGDDGMSELVAHLPADLACAAYDRINAIARSMNRRDDERSMDEIRADVLTELLLGKHQSYRTVEVQVTVPVSSLLGASDLPAELAGHGWIPAGVAREIAADPSSTWQRLLTDPATGQLLEVGRTRYRPPASLDDYVRARDRHCRVPGCRRPARHCDVDHNHDWAEGGETNADLLCTLCRRHHRLKDAPGWNFDLVDGELIITTPAGRSHRSKPPPVAEPEPDPPPEPSTVDNSPPPF